MRPCPRGWGSWCGAYGRTVPSGRLRAWTDDQVRRLVWEVVETYRKRVHEVHAEVLAQVAEEVMDRRGLHDPRRGD